MELWEMRRGTNFAQLFKEECKNKQDHIETLQVSLTTRMYSPGDIFLLHFAL